MTFIVEIVQEDPSHTIRTYVDWLSSGIETGERQAAEVRALPPSGRETFLRALPADSLFHVLDALLDHVAHESLVSDPKEAAELTDVVTRLVAAVTVPAGCELRRTMLHGNAWRERANALRLTGDLPQALGAAERAIAILAPHAAADLELAMAQRVAAFIRHQLGEVGAPLRIIREGIDVFRKHGDRAGELRSRNFEGFIAFDAGNYAEACSIFERTLGLAEEIGDDTMKASLHNNIGHCAQLLGDRVKAIDHLIAALKLFEVDGMAAERPHAAWGLAQVAADSGSLERALSELTTVASDLLGRGMPLEAARVWLDITELLVLAERHADAATLAADLVERFTAAGAPREALRALGLLRDTASKGRLSSESIQSVRQSLIESRG